MGPCFYKRPWKTQLRGLSKNRPGPIFCPFLVQIFKHIYIYIFKFGSVCCIYRLRACLLRWYWDMWGDTDDDGGWILNTPNDWVLFSALSEYPKDIMIMLVESWLPLVQNSFSSAWVSLEYMECYRSAIANKIHSLHEIAVGKHLFWLKHHQSKPICSCCHCAIPCE